MGMKSKVRSMQRGALVRSDDASVTNADLYRKSPPLLTDDERSHFQFGNRSINNFFLGLEDILLACHQNHLAAGDVAKVLNKKQARTACGAPWTPRLAWFLMKTWRTIYFQKLELKRQRREASEQAERRKAPERADTSPIERAVERQKADTFKKVLRNYFKNPTLGEIFPELSALKQALLKQEGVDLELGGTATEKPDLPLGPSRKAETTKARYTPSKKPPRSSVIQAQPDPQAFSITAFSGMLKDFFFTVEGRRYLAELVRSNPRLLELAPATDERFLGSLRARKSPHPSGAYWTETDAEQVRLAVLAGMRQQGRK